MRGEDRVSGVLFSYVDLEARVPAKHPLRAMRDLVNASLVAMDASFSELYKAEGLPLIPPEPLSARRRFRRSSVRAPPSLRHAKSDILILIVAPFRIASPELLPKVSSLPHLYCSFSDAGRWRTWGRSA